VPAGCDADAAPDPLRRGYGDGCETVGADAVGGAGGGAV